MATWKAGGYVIRQYANDHEPAHVHVYLDGRLVARVTLRAGKFMKKPRTPRKHRGRILAALRSINLID